MAGAWVDKLGNPLLRAALDAGVKVIAAHFASEGRAPDDHGAVRPCWELLLEMMREPKWRHLLLADISAIIIFKRVHVLKALLALGDEIFRASSTAPIGRCPRWAVGSSAHGRSRSPSSTAARGRRSW